MKREEALGIHQEKKGHFTVHVGQRGKKEGPSKCCSKGGERSSILKEGMRGLSQSLRDEGFVESLILRLLLTRNCET